MPKEKKNEEKKGRQIPKDIIEAISSLRSEKLIGFNSCPAYQLGSFDIQEKLDENLEKMREKEYKIGNYLVKKTLGQGTFGKVKLGIYLPTKEKVAIKILEKERILEKDDEIRVKREFDMLAKFNHPNVILVAEIFESFDSYYSVMEYCVGGELFNYIVKNSRLCEEEASFFYYQLINGLEYIHSLGIVHRDLKPENLLLTSDNLLKIIDFGLSNYFRDGQDELLSTPCGSPCYASPEMVGGKKYNGFKIDIWSTGIILYAMLCGYLPFEDKDNEKLFEKILECKLIFPKFISKMAKDLMEKILVTDPDNRITIPEIKRHPFYLKGKKIFEQEFSVFQIIRDKNNQTSLIEDIDINNILEPSPRQNENESKDNDKEKIDEKFINNKDKEYNESNTGENKKEDNIKDKKKEDKNYNIEEIEITIDLRNENNNKKEETEEKNIDIKKEENKKKESVQEKDNKNVVNNEKIHDEENNKDTPYDIKESANNKKINKEIIRSNNINENKISLQKKNENFKEKEKVKEKEKDSVIVTLIKDTNHHHIRRKLIKNRHKLNIREKTRAKICKSSQKDNKVINSKKLNQIITAEISINLKRIKNGGNSKKLSEKKLKNKIDKKFILNKNIGPAKTSHKINSISKEFNNTIDNGEIPKKLKLNFNLNSNKINDITGRGSRPQRSIIHHHNMKLNSFEKSRGKRKTDSNIKKNSFSRLPLSRGGFNLLHKKNLKKINLNLKNNYKIKHYLEETKKRNLLKTEINKPKGKYLLNIKEIKKLKFPNSNVLDKLKATDNINSNNTNIKIIDDTKYEDSNNNKKLSISKKKSYNSNTNYKVKLVSMIKINKINNEYIKKALNKRKNILNKNNNKNYNMKFINNLENRNTINSENKENFVNFNISTNIESSKLCNTILHSEKKNAKGENSKNYFKKPTPNKKEVIEKPNLQIDPMIKNINTNDMKYLPYSIKTDPGKKLAESNKRLVPKADKEDKNNLLHMKIIPINSKNTQTYKDNKKKIKSKIIQKNLNKTSNNSNMNNYSIKNPFISTESTNFSTMNMNRSSFNSLNSTKGKKNKISNNNNKLLINKKKPYVTIRNTVINFNMIESGLIITSLNRKKELKKKGQSEKQNSSIYKVNTNTNNFRHNYLSSFTHDCKFRKAQPFQEKTFSNRNKNIKINFESNNKHIKLNRMRADDFKGFKKKKLPNKIRISSNLNSECNNKLNDIEYKIYKTINNTDPGTIGSNINL